MASGEKKNSACARRWRRRQRRGGDSWLASVVACKDVSWPSTSPRPSPLPSRQQTAAPPLFLPRQRAARRPRSIARRQLAAPNTGFSTTRSTMARKRLPARCTAAALRLIPPPSSLSFYFSPPACVCGRQVLTLRGKELFVSAATRQSLYASRLSSRSLHYHQALTTTIIFCVRCRTKATAKTFNCSYGLFEFTVCQQHF